jgi:hypothetical protein
MNWKRMAAHFAAQAQAAKDRRDYDGLVTLRRLAALMAVEMYKTDIEKALGWLEACGFGDTVLMGLRSYYRNALEGVLLKKKVAA